MSETNESELTQEIRDAAAAPKSSDHDGTMTQERDLRELIEADRHLAEQKATKSKTFGLRFARLSPPGTT
jgi:hypothetical protein